MRHQEHVASGIVVVVEGVVINVTEHSACSQERIAGFVEIYTERMNEGGGVWLVSRDCRWLDLGLVGRCFKSLNHGVGLQKRGSI